ncbi:MAG: hypothetical protein GC168_00150 [Candidatus Hydrogenedens sp.]|nr:hypothetical protein [Candidatus Hydrogenedens sp.]
MQQAISLVVALAIGLVAGALGVHFVREADLQKMQAQLLEQEQAAKARLELAKTQADERLHALEAEVESAKAQLYDREDKLAEVEASATSAQEQLRRAELEAQAALEAQETEGAAEEAPAEADSNREDRERWRGGWGDMTEEQRQEMANRFRDGMNQFFDEEYAYAKDAESQERIAALGDYANQMFDLRRAMRDATTDEEREALRAQSDEMREASEKLLREQQNAMLRDVATAHGIKGKDSKAYIRDMRAVMESPFFTFPMGGRGPGGPGGFGGGPRGGGGGRGGGAQ